MLKLGLVVHCLNLRVRNGLRQGCTLAPTLLTFFSAVVSTWRTECVEVGVNV